MQHVDQAFLLLDLCPQIWDYFLTDGDSQRLNQSRQFFRIKVERRLLVLRSQAATGLILREHQPPVRSPGAIESKRRFIVSHSAPPPVAALMVKRAISASALMGSKRAVLPILMM